MDMNEVRNELQKSYGTGYNDGYSKGYEDGCADRPQGKWVLSDLQSQADNDNGNYAYVCTNCNHTDVHAKTQKVPYCWWCGASMKGASDE